MNFQHAKKLFVENGLEYSELLHEKLTIYYNFLIDYNNKINLTAITDEEEVWIKHFIDSILINKFVNIPENSTIIDVGTGAGFPSIPLKLYRNDLNVTLLDSLSKRITFLTELSTKLNINVETLNIRAEEASKNPKYREKFDIVTARAVANMTTLCEYCMGFLKIGGHFIAMKGISEDISASSNALKIMGGEISDNIQYNLNGKDGRKIFLIKKISHTPSKYPRNSGQIKKKPL